MKNGHTLNNNKNIAILFNTQTKLLHFILLFLFAVLLLSGFFNCLVNTQYFIVGLIEFSLSFICLSAYIASKKRGYRSLAAWIATLVTGFIIFFLIIIAKGSEDIYALALLFTLIAYALLGIKQGTAASAVFTATLAALLFNGYALHPSTTYNVLIALIFGGGIVYYFEFTKEFALQHLQELNTNLEERVQKGVEELRNKDKLVIKTAKNAVMGEMIGAISHQWKQPLNALGLYIQDVEDMQKMDELDEAQMKAFVDNSMRQIHFMSETINNFRDFLKPDKNKESFLIHSAVSEVLSLLNKEMAKHDIKINFSYNEIETVTYKGELEQVILNLVNNAKDELVQKAQKDKSFTPEIAIEIKNVENKNIITVTDNGDGITDKNLPRIFESHFTTKSKEKGTGIGLYICKMIVESSLNGSIFVENAQEGGARFTLTF